MNAGWVKMEVKSTLLPSKRGDVAKMNFLGCRSGHAD